ncbi:MAG TPA: hypothetical protein VH210_08660 [Gaiellaceae bacterium]|jgi:uncharacterized protein YukE|nr:hypothetical protein [Gaiellaceae bacterium]
MRSSVIALALVLVGVAAGAGVSRGASAAGPTLVSAPSAVGAPVVGQRLTALRGTWSGSGTISYHYQWYRCDSNAAHCTSVHGATGPSYKLVAADATRTIGLTVNATDSSGTASGYAGAVGLVAPATATFVSTVQPMVTGTAQQGRTLQVDNGAWSKSPTSFTYSWLRCNQNGRVCMSIAGATTASYVATAADAGHAVIVLVTASSGSATAAALSAAATSTPGSTGTTTTTTRTQGPKSTAAPAVSGGASQGSQLTATPGTWTGSGTISYAYQWYRCDAAGAHCSSVHGATAATYKLGTQDVTHTMGLTVNASDSAGKASAYASLVGPVAAAGSSLIATAQPTVSGTGAARKPVSVTTGTWSPAATAYSYAWQRCNANGRICAPIAGATLATYTVVAADSGHQLLAIVQATSGNNTAKTFSKSLLAP